MTEQQTESNGRGLDDRIKVVAASILLGVVPVGAFLWSQVSAVERSLAEYKLQVATSFVSNAAYAADMEEVKALLREVRDEIRDHERQSSVERKGGER